MFEPYGKKSISYRNDVPFLCPTDAQPYFATKKNSGKARSQEVAKMASDFNSWEINQSMADSDCFF